MQNTHGEANATLGENLLFFSSALMIHVFRQSTRLAAEAMQAGDGGPAPPLGSPAATVGPLKPPGYAPRPGELLHWHARNEQLHVDGEVTGASFPILQAFPGPRTLAASSTS